MIKATVPRTFRALRSGWFIDLSEPDWRNIDMAEVAAVLGALARFNGHPVTPISVAAHSLDVAERVPPALRLAALLHDAKEWALGDFSRPVLAALDMEFGGTGGVVSRLVGAIGARLDRAIAMAALFEAGCPEQRLDALARRLASQMIGVEVGRADDAAGDEELRLWHGLGRRFVAEGDSAGLWLDEARCAALIYVTEAET